MMNNPSILAGLEQLLANGVEPKHAQLYLDQIRDKENFLADPHHPIYFIGPVGIGKSSLIAVAGQLLVDLTPPKNRQDLQKQSVLATGSGRTTVCEVQIEKHHQIDNIIKLKINPVSNEQMAEEITFYATDVWNAQNKAPDDSHADDIADGQEVHRFIRNMCGYADVTESTYLDGVRKRRSVKPFEEAAKKFTTAKDFVDHMVAAAKLDQRHQKEWVISGTRPERMQQLQKLFANLNQGSQPDATLPQKITLFVPETLPDSGKQFEVSWVDTRGLDGGIESRADLQDCLRDPRALFVLCTSFNDAPNTASRAVLRAMHTNRQFHGALERSLLLLVDADNAATVNGAGGDRELGQSVKIDECVSALRHLKLGDLFSLAQIIAFDVLQDDRFLLINKLTQRLEHLRNEQQKNLDQLYVDAKLFLENVNDQRRSHLKAEIDNQIQIALSQHFATIGTDSLLDAPLSAPIEGVLKSIRDTPYASRVRASCRRAGVFASLNVYAATQFYAATQASNWLKELMFPVWQTLEQLAQDESLAYGKDLIDSKQREVEQAENTIVTEYADSIKLEMEALLFQPVRDKDTESLSYKTWLKCIAEWGQGDGFKKRVEDHLKSWAHKQVFRAHERTRAYELFPFLESIKLPENAPDFVLRVRNLRALKEIEWSPRDICILIGGNGAGKSTLLLCLRLLNLAFKSSLPDAVRQLFGGSHHLRHWHAGEDEEIEISLQIGETVWTFALQISEGGVDAQSKESFSHNSQVIFTRDSLGTLLYQGERLEIGDKMALRALLDRGVKSPELKKFERFLLGIRLLHDPDLYGLRKNGSFLKDDKHLFARGDNVLTMLRSWYQDQTQRFRFDFVEEGMRDAFPHQVSLIDFNDNGTTLVARLSHPDHADQPIPLENQPNGVLQMLILLSAMANAEKCSVLALDEPENCLHPYALKAFVRQAKMWAKKQHLTIILSTHSVALLNLFSSTPEQVFVMKQKEGDERLPQRLDQLYDPEWLSCFQLGELYEREELVSNGDE